MLFLLTGTSAGKALLYGALRGALSVLFLSAIYAIIAFLKKGKQKNSDSAKSRSLRYEDALRQVGGNISSGLNPPTDAKSEDGSVGTAASSSEIESISETPSIKHNKVKNSSRLRFPIVTILLCLLFLGLGIAGGFYWRDVQAKAELESNYIDFLSQMSKSNIEQYNKGSDAGYSAGWNNGYLLGFENGAYFAMDEIDAGRGFFLTDLDGLGITLSAKKSLEENQP